jgi:hypothetical protein
VRFRGYPSKGARAAFSPPQRRITITECDLAHRLSPDWRVSDKVCASAPWRVDRHWIVVGKRSGKKIVNCAYAARHSMAGFQCTPRFLSAR